MNFTFNSAFEAWQYCLGYLEEHGNIYEDVRGRKCKELLSLSVKITSVDEITLPILSLLRTEKWSYPPLTEIEQAVMSLKESQGFLYHYSKRLFGSDSVPNQIDSYVLPILQKDPQSRRAVATVFLPELDSCISNREVPSMLAIDFKLRDNSLHVSCMFRSQDFYLGWPANIYQLYVISMYVAKKLGVMVGSLSTYATSAHYFLDFERHMNDVLTKSI